MSDGWLLPAWSALPAPRSAAAAVLGVTGAGPGALAGADTARVERVVRDYVLAHPEIIPEAMQRLQERETGQGDRRAAARRSSEPYRQRLGRQSQGRRHRGRVFRL